MSIEINEIKHSNYTAIHLTGKCTIYTVTKLKNIFLNVLEQNEQVLVDLEKISDFDTAGLQLFISVKNMTKRNNKKIKFINHPESVIALMDLYGLTSFFGDKIILTSEQKKSFSFQYGIKKLPSFMY